MTIREKIKEFNSILGTNVPEGLENDEHLVNTIHAIAKRLQPEQPKQALTPGETPGGVS